MKSLDSGNTWISVNSGLHGALLLTLSANDSNIFVATSGGSGVYRSFNDGDSWSPVNTSLEYNTKLVLLGSGSKLYAGTDSGVFLTKDNGDSWVAINTGLPQTLVSTLALDKSYIFGGTSDGIWRRPLSELVTAIRPFHESLEFSFGPTDGSVLHFGAPIEFSLKQEGLVELCVLDIHGRKVLTLMNSKMNPGKHKVILEGARLTQGLYFLRLRANGVSQTKRFFLEK